MKKIHTVIVGAGPYGLSIAAHLEKLRVPYQVLGTPMESWRNWMPTGMMLRSEAHASNLWDGDGRFTLEKFCRERALAYRPSGPPVPIGTFLEYCEWFRAKAVSQLQDAKVGRLSKGDEGFRLELDDGTEMTAKRVVVATGHRAFRHIPSVFSEASAGYVSHSCDHADLVPLKNRNVIVVGGGQSSLETAALLHEQGASVRILVRRPAVAWNPLNLGSRSYIEKVLHPESGLGFGWKRLAQSELPSVFPWIPEKQRIAIAFRALGPSGAWWLRPRVENLIPVSTSHEVVNYQESGALARLEVRTGAQVKTVEAEHIVAATGFKPTIERLNFLDGKLRGAITNHNGLPTLTSSYESSVPGLHFAGILAAGTFGPVMRFMFGAKHTARALSRELARD